MFELLGLGAHEVEAAAAANRGAAPAAYVVLVERALVEWAAGCRAEGTLQPARRRERAHVDTRAAAHARPSRRPDPPLDAREERAAVDNLPGR